MTFSNKRFARLEVPDNPACIILRDEARPIPRDDFQLRLSGEIVCLGIDDDGDARWQDAAKVWRESASKHVYRRIAFTNKPVPSDTMNLFRGYGVTPKKGDCGLILQHIQEVICAGDPVVYEAMLSLIAWQLQHIGEPSRIIVALISEPQQTGKGSLLESVLFPIFGFAGIKVSDIQEITGTFNAILRGKAFVFLDEALFRGDKRAANQVKSLVATQTVALNEKFLPRVHTPVGINIWLASNEEVPVHVEEHDARYWPLWVSPHRWVNPERSKEENTENVRYWDALHREIANGGLHAFLHEMLTRDISGFRPQRDVPRKNQAHATLVRGGLNEGDPRFWLEESLDNDVLLYVPAPRITADDLLTTSIADLHDMQQWTPGGEVRSGNLLAAYRVWVTKLRGYNIAGASLDDFWKLMTTCGFEAGKSKGVRIRKIPDREECRRRLKALLEGTTSDGVAEKDSNIQ